MSSFHSILVLIAVALFLNPLECKHNGFTVDLIRRDQPQKSISSSSSSHFEWLSKSFKQSLSRGVYFKHALISKQSSVTPSNSIVVDSRLSGLGGEYVMEVYIGKPPVKIVAIADTGSDVAWTQCKPCIHCYKQNDPLFDTNKTSSYRKLSCHSPQCRALPSTSCDRSNNKCIYELTYGDKSQSRGDLAVESFQFATSGNVFFPNTVFGCGHDNSGTFNETASGIIGLGGGELSIVNQFSKVLRKKFSYCLVPIDKSVSSKISFGVDSIPKGSKAVSTPLIKGSVDTFYFITLEGVSVVGDHNVTTHRINDSSSPVQEGNIIIDSGTTLTILPSQIYEDLKTAIISSISVEPSPDPSGTFDLCYEIDSSSSKSSGINFPDLVFHFKNADVEIPAFNSFLEVSRGLVCLTMVPTDDIAIFGNLSQMNFLVEYDIENQKLSFLPTDCTKVH